MATTSLQGAYDQTRRWIESNDPERAIGLAQHILQYYPSNLEAYRMLGEAYLARRQLDKAQEAFEYVLGSDPENIPAHVGLGITFERQGKLDQAVPEFEQAWEIKPDMTELRSQLLRLYAEAWGSEHAQLRLSRAGLARLYAKGHMLPQAITEFRQVIADQPNRHDASIALAEALWRDGQENESIALCRDILAQRPNSLKANLLLGYLLLAQGKPEGQRFWDTATQIDPFLTVAQAMFETLPATQAEQVTLPEWDEAAWRRQQELERQPVPAATRPIPIQTVVGPGVSPTAAPLAVDDFLAVLLAGGSQSVASEPQTTPVASSVFPLHDVEVPVLSPSNDDEPVLAPFSLADLGLSDEEITNFDSGNETTQPGTVSAPADAPAPFSFDAVGETPAADDELTMTPFSLSDLGLSDEEINGLSESTQDAPAGVPRAATSEPALTPFSLNDLGLTDDEIANLNDLGDEPAVTPRAPISEPALTPFSLSDLGLTDDEIANLNDLGDEPAVTPRAPTSEPALTPFSLSDLGLSDEEISSLSAPNESTPAFAAEADETPTFEPFSLSDLGLTDDEIASLNEPASPKATPFGQSPTNSGQESFSTDLLPFSLDEIDADQANSSLPSSLQPFSLDEPASEHRSSSFNSPESFSSSTDEDDDTIAQSGGYSWQQPPQRSRPNYLSTPHRDPLMPDGESIFDKLKQRRGQEIEPQAPPLPPTKLPPDEPVDDRLLFSMDDISLRDDILGGAAAEPQASSITPIAQPSDDLSSGLSSGQIQPFSLTDLGLSAEEIAALGLGGDSGAAQNFSAMLDSQPTATESVPATQDSFDTSFAADATPSDTALETGTPVAATPEPYAATSFVADAAPPTVTDDRNTEFTAPNQTADADAQTTIESLSPFSLADLGLSDDEIAALGLDEPGEDSSGLRITEEELAGLDLGGDIDLSAIHSQPIDSPGSGDALLDRLLTLGREQGYVDISDIIAGVANPEAESERIEQIGQLLHENNIKIYDGDEEVDMDAEYAAEETDDLAAIDFGKPAAAPREPDMTPFSLADLGLSDAEIASLGLGEATSKPEAQAAPAPAEPDMTPFSFADLGLSDAEISSLGLGESAMPNVSPTPAEPDMTPFSFADLGLSDEEISSLGLGESAMPNVSPAPAEPDMTPFSFADLGLSDAEIASLQGASDPAAAPVELPPPAPTPAPAPEPVREPAPAPEPVREPAPAPEPVVAHANTALVQPRQSPGLSNAIAAQVPALAGYLQRLQDNPTDHKLRLSLARISGQIGQTDAAVQQYKNIIRQNVLLDVVADDLSDLISDTEDGPTMQRLHRLLGDVYSKQGRIDEAMSEYNWTYGTSTATS